MSQSVLDTNVLVLNRFYMAIRVVNVRRAFTLLYRDCAEVIDNENNQYVSYDFESWCELSQLTSIEKQPGEDYIQAVGFELQVPRIVRLTRFDKMPTQTVRFNRKNLFARDDHMCQYCGRNEPAQQAQSGSRDSTLAWRPYDVGEHRLLLPALQQSQGWSNA